MDPINTSGGKLEWSALEYEDRERSPDWFWALGIVIVTSAIASLIFGNYFFALLILLSGVLLGFYAIKKPDTVFYELNADGLKIRSRIYLYPNIKSFWVQTELKEERIIKPVLFIKSERAFIPMISVPIPYDMNEEIRDVMLAHDVPEEEMKEHIAEKIMDFLGF